MRFDEVELDAVPLGGIATVAAPPGDEPIFEDAPRLSRAAAFLTDLSLFAALTLALSPLLPASQNWMSIGALAGFVAIVSFYYFVGCWMLWGRTIGGAIFDVRVVESELISMTMKAAAARWAALYLCIATASLGFLLALLPARKSLADRLSRTRCVRA